MHLETYNTEKFDISVSTEHVVCIWEVFKEWARFFFFISTIINKGNNKLVLKNVCHFQLLEISPTEFVNRLCQS